MKTGRWFGKWQQYAVCGLILLTGLAAEATINVDMVVDNPYAGPGATSAGGLFWNSYTTYGGGSISNLKLADGVTTTGIGFSMTAAPGNTGQWPSGPYADLLDDGFVGVNSTTTFTLSNLPGGRTFNLYLYGTIGNVDAGAVFTVGATVKNATGFNDTSFVQGANYVLYTNLSANAFNEITGTWQNFAYTPFSAFNGLQLEIIPEPSTVMLLGLGAAVAYWRRARSV